MMLLRLSAFLVFSCCLCGCVPQVIPWQSLTPAKRIEKPLIQDASNNFLEEVLSENLHDLINSGWKLFQMTYNRRDPSRLHIFQKNFIKAYYHNLKFRKGLVTYEMGINEFSDRTEDELKRMRCLHIKPQSPRLHSKYIPSSKGIPDAIDWRHRGAVTPVKNQGGCGSCWAFSTTGSIEGQYFKAKQKLLSFSEQQLVDCSSENNGCNGGLMTEAFKYLETSHGLNTEEEYPYTSGVTGSANPNCTFNPSRAHVKVTDYVELKSFDENMLKDAIGTIGPVSVAINAGVASFSGYHSGIYADEECSGDLESLDHGVLAVGYGEENGIPYWLIKNSWGPHWGENGYIRIRRNLTNMCGVASMPSYPIVDARV